jgi:hypothetical protein
MLLLPPTSTVALPPLGTLFPEATLQAKAAFHFYEQNYTTVGQWILDPATKVVLRSSRPGTCRFCNQTEPQVAFRQEAHALPEGTGNKSLTTDYECDECNKLFGAGIENDFGNWSKAQRALSGVKGKKKVPALKGKEWRFDRNSMGIIVTQSDGEPIAVLDETRTHITLTVRRDPYTPVAVLKAFTKMALSLLPEEELPNFKHAMAWIRNPDHQVGLVKVSGFPILYTFVPGPNPLPHSAIMLRRTAPNSSTPYMVFVLAYGNEIFQMFVPCPCKDRSICVQKDKLHYFPNPYQLDRALAPVAPIQRALIDLTGRTPVKGEMIETVLRCS